MWGGGGGVVANREPGSYIYNLMIICACNFYIGIGSVYKHDPKSLLKVQVRRWT